MALPKPVQEKRFQLIFLVAALGSYMMTAVIRFTLGLAIPGMSDEFSLTRDREGFFMSTYLLGMISGATLTGRVARKLHGNRTLILGASLQAGGVLLLRLSPQYATSLLFAYAAGFGAGFVTPSIYARMGTVVPRSRGFLVGFTNSLFTIGGFLGSFVGAGLIAGGEWRTPFAFYGIAAFLMIAVMTSLRGKLEDRRGAGQQKREDVPYRELLGNRNVLLIGGGMFCGNFAFTSFLTFAPTFLTKVRGISLESVGLMIGVLSLTGGLSAVLTGFLSDRFERRRLAVVIYILASGSSALIVTQAAPLLTLMLLAALFGAGILPFWNLLVSTMQDLFAERGSVTATALAQNMAWMGALVGPLASGVALLYLDFQPTLLATISTPLLLGGILSLSIGQQSRRS